MKVLRSDKKGLTLVEVLVSAAILGIVLISLLGVFVVGKFGSARAKHHMEAINHARAAMELLKNDLNATFTLPDGDIKNLDGSYTPNFSYPYGEDAGITQVTVTISWTPPTWGVVKEVSEELVTLISE